MTAPARTLYTSEILGAATALAEFGWDESLPLRGEARSRRCGSTLALGLGLLFCVWPPAVGVGSNPDSLPEMKCSNVRRRKHSPVRIVPERGQVSENSSHPESKQPWDVLHDHVARSKVANGSGILSP